MSKNMTGVSSVLDVLPHGMGLRVELDCGEAYYLKSGWAGRWDGILWACLRIRVLRRRISCRTRYMV